MIAIETRDAYEKTPRAVNLIASIDYRSNGPNWPNDPKTNE